MQALREWSISVVSACAVVAAMSFLVPSGVSGKAFKTVCGLFLILCFVSPLAKLDFDVKADKYTAGLSEWIYDSDLEETVEKQISSTLADEIKSGISAYLDNSCIEEHTVDVRVSIDSADNISVEYICIEIPQCTDSEELINYVRKQYGIVPEINCSSGEEE